MRKILTELEALELIDKNGQIFIGGTQEWYEDRWKKASGCGPVAASNIVWYMTRRHGGREQYMEIMKEMFEFVTPGIRGVNSSSIFTEGFNRYAQKNNLLFTHNILEVPKKHDARPGIDETREFIVSGVQNEAPVAFLNLSNGSLINLENWHWVTILAIDTDSMLVTISDYGKLTDIDISEWLKTSMLGGTFVYFMTNPAPRYMSTR